jgi:hypothetical protein
MGSTYPNASVPLLLALQQSQHPVPRTFSLISSAGTCLPLCLLSLLIYFTGAHRAYANTLARFLVFFGIWTGRPVKSVQDCLCEALVDKAPLSGRASIVEAFLLWIADSVESPGAAMIPPITFIFGPHVTPHLIPHNPKLNTLHPASHASRLTLGFCWTDSFTDKFQHACVHLKYVLRGAAMLHCMKFILPKRQSAWCIKWFAALLPHTCLVAHTLSGCPLKRTHSYLGHGWFTKSVWLLSFQV